MTNVKTAEANKIFARKLVLIVVGMFGFGFALVPLYDVFCRLTGLNGKVDLEAATKVVYPIDPTRKVTVEFMTSVNGATPLNFYGEISKLKVVPGEFYTAKFRAENLKSESMIGQAVPSIAPGLAAPYLRKTECFCFSRQKFKAGERKTMPVRFVIDPELPKQYKTVTLAYTFFDVSHKKP